MALASACADDPGDGMRSPCPDDKPCDVSMTFLHTSDIHSRLVPYELQITQVDSDLGLGPINELVSVGGVARMSGILGRERARAGRVLHVDSGDCFQGAPIYNFFQGEPEVRSLAAMGVDAAVLGNHDFDSGALNLARQLQRWGGTFSSLAANYYWDDSRMPNYAQLSHIARPYRIFQQGGLKIAVIGMANISTMTGLFNQPNSVSITPLNTVNIAQAYIDSLRPHVDLVTAVTHMGLENDQLMVRGTTGLDIVFGGHNHIVLNPPQQITDCHGEGLDDGFIWAEDPNYAGDDSRPPPNDDRHPDPIRHPYQFKRQCKPRNVNLVHSGAFAKYVGRLDLVLSNNPERVSPTGLAKDYDKVNGFEVVTSRFKAIPVEASAPQDPVVIEMLLPYQRGLDLQADLQLIAGYSPEGAARIASNGGDSPLGNLIATAMWLRLGVQSDFSFTNSTGIRADLLPGPVTTEQLYNIFPFNNTIAKMQLSGVEVRQLFDYIARRSASRGCTSQVQIAGSRARLNCTSCERPEYTAACTSDSDCPSGVPGACGVKTGRCSANSCAEEVFIGHTPRSCNKDADCANGGLVVPDQCDLNVKKCSPLLVPTNRYELATSDYLASGGSGFRVLQRNTTQLDTKINMRDAMLDFIRAGKPCGYKKEYETAEGLKACTGDPDCNGLGGYACSCANGIARGDGCTSDTSVRCPIETGRCVLAKCRDDVAKLKNRACDENKTSVADCRAALNACSNAGEQCKALSCVDKSMGAISDGRLDMVGR